MKRYAMVFSLLVVGVAGCKSSSVPSEPQTAPQASVPIQSAPQFDWKQYAEETVEVQPSQTRTFAVPPGATRLRVILNADESVDAGVMSKATFQSMKGNVPVYVGSTTFNDLPCALIAAVKDEARCSLDPQQPSLFVVHDPRSATGDPVAEILGKKPTTSVAKQGIPPSKIRLTLSEWVCVANCTSAEPAK